MPSLQPSIEGSPTLLEDPWDWSVEQVIFALTDPESFLLKTNSTLSLPNSTKLANILRENDVNGLALLHEVQANSLRDDMGIKSMSHRASINHLIRLIQGMSQKYQQHHISFRTGSSLGMRSCMATPFMGSPQYHEARTISTVPGPWESPSVSTHHKNQVNTADECAAAQESRNLPRRDILAEARAISQPDSESTGPCNDTQVSGINIVEANDENGGACITEGLLQPSKNARTGIYQDEIPASRSNTAQSEQWTRPNETTVIDGTGRKRRRLVLTKSTSDRVLPNSEEAFQPEIIDEESTMIYPVEVESLPQIDKQIEDLTTSSLDPPVKSPEPGVQTVDKNGRKRMRPVLVEQIDHRTQLAEEAAHNRDRSRSQELENPENATHFEQRVYGRKAIRMKHQIYLGPDPIPVDELFYGDARLESRLDHVIGKDDDDDNYVITPDERPGSGTYLYVNARMKYFLQSPSVSLERGGVASTGVIPYSSRVGRRHCPLSITVFSHSRTGVSAIRSNRKKWFGDESDKSRVSVASNPDFFHIADPTLMHDQEPDFEWDALEKWNHIEQDKVLPIYGESGSEGEYELDTWKEIEEEHGQLVRPSGTSKSRKLTGEEVDLTIDNTMKQLVDQWTVKQKPKLQLKAWKEWIKARRYQTTQIQITDLDQKIDRLGRRLDSLRREITAEEWSTTSQLAKQCIIIQPSIFDREDCKWKSSILNLPKMPPKPPPTERKKKKPKADQKGALEPEPNEDEEDLRGDDHESETSDGSLDNFIVEDDEHMNEPIVVEEDFALADVEDAVDSETVMEDQESSPLKQSIEPKMEAVKAVNRSSVIDLTLESDPIDPENEVKSKPCSDIKTPPLNASDESDVFLRSRSRKAVFKMPNLKSSNVINLESDSTESMGVESPSTLKKALPAFTDVVAIRHMDPSQLVERQDRKRLLIWMIAHAKASRRQAALTYVSQASFERAQTEVTAALKKIRGCKPEIDNEIYDSIMSIASWHVCWTIPVKTDQSGLRTSHINATLADEDGFEPFYDFLQECLSHYNKALAPSEHNTPSKKQRKLLLDSGEDLHTNPLRKRKYVVTESQDTLAKRQAAQKRLHDDEERRLREVRNRRSMMGSSLQDGANDVIVNPGKLEDQEYIYLNSRCGASMKEHQRSGLRFMWREITTDHKDLQGCLLAHNQGLGKTMQIIALLVTIAEAAKSSSHNIRHQIPRKLRRSQTLVLCPVTLVENWCDELHLWVPDPASRNIGKVWKVSSSMLMSLRLSEIQAWSDEGGVLVIGYDTFKNLIRNKTQLSPEQYDAILQALLERPNLVVADEAQNFKNRKSNVGEAIYQIKTGSRIALTGTPLSNDIGEYFALIDWVSPNYLGSRAEFRAIYEEPIYEGLYSDSTISQYRESRKRLLALEMELGPKVHRAGVEVLHGELRGKMEFVIKVPLTSLQQDLYRIYVESALVASKEDEPKQATLWSWLSLLQLLCNHPHSFRTALNDLGARAANQPPPAVKTRKKKTSQPVIEGEQKSSEEDALLNESISRVAISRAVPDIEKVVGALNEPLDALCLSNKMLILMSILDSAESAQDKVLVFSHRIGTLDYIEEQLIKGGKSYLRLDGSSQPQKRQQTTKNFNDGSASVCLISTRAGGTGLNLFGGNRVVLLDENFNPTWERQAIGRAYRIGQSKTVYVYRLTADGTFEQIIQNQALFKEQLATRVIDQKNPNRGAHKGARHYLFPPKPVKKDPLDQFWGKDPLVLDHLLADQTKNQILSIIPTETFHVEDGVELTPDEKKDAEQIQRERKDGLLRRRVPEPNDPLMRERIHLVQEHTRPPLLAYGPLPPGDAAIPWPSLTHLNGNMTQPPSAAPSFMGGLPYPAVGITRPSYFPSSSPPHSSNLPPQGVEIPSAPPVPERHTYSALSGPSTDHKLLSPGSSRNPVNLVASSHSSGISEYQNSEDNMAPEATKERLSTVPQIDGTHEYLHEKAHNIPGQDIPERRAKAKSLLEGIVEAGMVTGNDPVQNPYQDETRKTQASGKPSSHRKHGLPTRDARPTKKWKPMFQENADVALLSDSLTRPSMLRST